MQAGRATYIYDARLDTSTGVLITPAETRDAQPDTIQAGSGSGSTRADTSTALKNKPTANKPSEKALHEHTNTTHSIPPEPDPPATPLPLNNNHPSKPVVLDAPPPALHPSDLHGKPRLLPTAHLARAAHWTFVLCYFGSGAGGQAGAVSGRD